MLSTEACVECGTCRVVCPHGSIEWNYPRSGMGIWYRFSRMREKTKKDRRGEKKGLSVRNLVDLVNVESNTF